MLHPIHPLGEQGKFALHAMHTPPISSQSMEQPFDLAPYSFSLPTSGHPPFSAFCCESSPQSNWMKGNPMPSEVDPYLQGLPRYLSDGSCEVDGTGNETEIPLRDGSWAGCHIEQCCAESCFFGCKGHTFHPGAEVGSHNPPTDRGTGYESGTGDSRTSDGSSSTDVIAPMQSRSRAGDPALWSESTLPSRSFLHALPNLLSHSLGYHSRHASVPSSPTQTSPQRQRRMSEPFTSILDRRVGTGVTTMESARSTGSSLQFSGCGRPRDPKPILFKTELCRSWEEKGSCRYG